MKRALALLVLVLVGILALASTCLAAEEAAAPAAPAAAGAQEEPPKPAWGPNVGDNLKDFKLMDPVENKEYALKDLTKDGRDVALVFMQTACSLCVDEIQDILSVKDDLASSLNVVLVSVDFENSRFKRYKDTYSIPYVMLHDPSAGVLKSLMLSSTPAMAFVDKSGKITGKVSGYNKADVKSKLKSYIR